MPEAGIIIETLPVGSGAVDVTNYGGQTLDGSVLDGLADGGSSGSLAFSNAGGFSTVRVVVLLNKFDPTAVAPVVSISNGASQYELPVSANNAAKRLEWNSIPVAFLTSFVVTNSTGAAFASEGNSIHIFPVS
jgi:hypothetical protein